jgi:hypothetical protein
MEKGDLMEVVLCGIATVTHRGMKDFNIIKATRLVKAQMNPDFSRYEYYHTLVFGPDTHPKKKPGIFSPR